MYVIPIHSLLWLINLHYPTKYWVGQKARSDFEMLRKNLNELFGQPSTCIEQASLLVCLKHGLATGAWENIQSQDDAELP